MIFLRNTMKCLKLGEALYQGQETFTFSKAENLEKANKGCLWKWFGIYDLIKNPLLFQAVLLFYPAFEIPSEIQHL